MGARVIALREWIAPRRDWTQNELAEFYRVEAALVQAGLRIETDRGVSDEGEPWFVFCRSDDGEVFIHFARTEGEYIVAGAGFDGVSRGRDFRSLVSDLIARHPLVQPRAKARSNVFVHPAAVLIAVVGTAFFKTSEARADDGQGGPEKPAVQKRSLLLTTHSTPLEANLAIANAQQTLVVVASAANALLNERGVRTVVSAATPATAALAAPSAATVAAASGGERAPTPPLSGAELAKAVGQAPAREVAQLLALTTLLMETMGAASPLPSAEPAAPLGEQLAGLPGDAQDATPPLFLVELRPGPLPDVTAVRLIQAAAEKFDLPTPVAVQKLPAFLSTLIEQGLHFGVPAGPPSSGALDVVHDAPTPVAPIDVDGPLPSTPGDGAPMPLPTPPQDIPTIVPGDGGTGFQLSPADQAKFEQAISYFLSHVPQPQVVINGDEVVMYDARLMNEPLLLSSATSVTFTFADGSSISFVGVASSLPDFSHLAHTGF